MIKMKTLYMIGGTMGAGKTAVSRCLNKLLPYCVFLDGDWCWNMDPFIVDEETKAMVTDNIIYLLNSFLRCSVYENIVFCWVMHEQDIIDGILSRLDISGCRVICVSLVLSEKSLRERLEGDILAGIREPDIIERSLARLPLYQKLNTYKLDVSGIPPERAAELICEIKNKTL